MTFLTFSEALALMLRGAGRWIRANVPRAILFAVVGFVVGLLCNVVMLAVVYNGIGSAPRGGPAMGPNNRVGGSVFWLLLPMLVSGLVSYRLQVGKQRFWNDLRGFPRSLMVLVQRDRSASGERILWGFGGAMLVAAILSPALSGLFAVGALVFAGRLMRPLLGALISSVYRGVVARVAPARQHPPSEAALQVALLGSTVAMLGAIFISNPIAKLGLAGVAVAAALLLNRRVPAARQAAVALLVIGGAAMLAVARESSALACDGGLADCGGSVAAWLACGAGPVLSQANLAAILSAGGSIVGGGAGALDPNQWISPRLKAAQAWKKTHPGEPWSEYYAAAEDKGSGPSFEDSVFDSMHQELESGEMRARLKSVFENVPAGLFHGLVHAVEGTVESVAEIAKYNTKYGPAEAPMWMIYDKLSLMYQNREAMSADMSGKFEKFDQMMTGKDTVAQGKFFADLAGDVEIQAILLKGPGEFAQWSRGGEPVMPAEAAAPAGDTPSAAAPAADPATAPGRGRASRPDPVPDSLPDPAAPPAPDPAPASGRLTSLPEPIPEPPPGSATSGRLTSLPEPIPEPPPADQLPPAPPTSESVSSAANQPVPQEPTAPPVSEPIPVPAESAVASTPDGSPAAGSTAETAPHGPAESTSNPPAEQPTLASLKLNGLDPAPHVPGTFEHVLTNLPLDSSQEQLLALPVAAENPLPKIEMDPQTLQPGATPFTNDVYTVSRDGGPADRFFKVGKASDVFTESGMYSPGVQNELAAHAFDEAVGWGRVPKTAPYQSANGVGTIQEAITGGDELPAGKYHDLFQQQMAVTDYSLAQADGKPGNSMYRVNDPQDMAQLRRAGVEVDKGDDVLGPVRHDNGATMPDPAAVAGDHIDIYIKSDYVMKWGGKPLLPEVIADLKRMDQPALAARWRQMGHSEAKITGALERLNEIIGKGRITGHAWKSQGGHYILDAMQREFRPMTEPW